MRKLGDTVPNHDERDEILCRRLLTRLVEQFRNRPLDSNSQDTRESVGGIGGLFL